MVEGIGHSVLEAMALGMCVVAPNASTMNEYVTNGLTGLLWDVERPRPIDFSDIASMGALARKRVEEGHNEWLGDQDRLRAFGWTPTAQVTSDLLEDRPL